MRHVILGANSFVGTFVLKLLVTIGEGIKIIAVSPTGKIDDEIIRDNIVIKTGDILNLKDLYDVFEKDDIIYNTQVIFDETHDITEVELVNYAGLINILGIARITGVSRIVSVLPQFEGSDEFNTEFHKITRKTTRIIENYFARKEFGWSSKAIRVWAKKNITEFKIPIEFYDDEFEDIEEESVQDTTSGPQGPKLSGPQAPNSEGPKLSGPQAPNSEGPKLSGPQAPNSEGPKLSGPQAPDSEGPMATSGPIPPKKDIIISNNQEKDEIIEENKSDNVDNKNEAHEDNKNEAHEDNTDEAHEDNKNGAHEDNKNEAHEDNKNEAHEDNKNEAHEDNTDEEEITKTDDEIALDKFWERQNKETERRKRTKLKLEEEAKKQAKIREKERKIKKELRRRELPKAKLAVARLGRIFGSYDHTITVEYCDAVRRGKLTVNGEINKQISWITPIDIGRALIILGDKTVPTGEYNMNSFIASPLEIIKQLDKQNHSKTLITHLDIKKELWRVKINNLLAGFGIGKMKETVSLFKYNVEQIFPDTEARNRWKWYPRYDFQKAIEDAFLWYIEVMVPIIYNIEIK